VARLREAVGVDERTLRRWRQWWQGRCARSGFWRGQRGRLVAPAADNELPASLRDRFVGEMGARLVLRLRLVSPISTRTCRRGV
jgi:hypothetical protein